MNNDRPPACSPDIGEDGKQVFKLQWPKASHVNHFSRVLHKPVGKYLDWATAVSEDWSGCGIPHDIVEKFTIYDCYRFLVVHVFNHYSILPMNKRVILKRTTIYCDCGVSIVPEAVCGSRSIDNTIHAPAEIRVGCKGPLKLIPLPRYLKWRQFY